jgi:hypothetical protein
MWLFIAALSIPVILLVAVWYRLWMYGENAQNVSQCELNPCINLEITRLDLDRNIPAKPQPEPRSRPSNI